MSCQRDVRAGPGDCERSTTRRARDRSPRGRTHGYAGNSESLNANLLSGRFHANWRSVAMPSRPFRRDPSTSRRPLDVGSITDLQGNSYASSRDIPSLGSIMGTGRRGAMRLTYIPNAKVLQEKKFENVDFFKIFETLRTLCSKNKPGSRRSVANNRESSVNSTEICLISLMGKDAWVAGADRREAPGPKPEHLGRRLWLRHQPPKSWQLLNDGDQRGVSA